MRLEPRPDLPQNGVAVAAEHDAHGVAVILQLQFILRFRPFAALVQPAAQKIFQPLVIFAFLAFGKDRVIQVGMLFELLPEPYDVLFFGLFF